MEVPSQRIVRQDVTFGMTLPVAGDARLSTILVLTTTGGYSHSFHVDGVLRKALAGPVVVHVETVLTVAEPPREPNLRQRLEAALWDNQGSSLEDQVSTVLELLSERPNLLVELEELTDDGE